MKGRPAKHEKGHVMLTTGAVVQLDENQFREAASVLTRAYFDDLFILYLLPDPAARQEQLSAFMEAACRLFDLLGHAYTTAGRMDGVALWRPPGVADVPPEWREAAGYPHVAEVWGDDAMGRFATAMTHLGELRHRAMPTAHWYLAGIGVDPPRQGQGVGGHLLQPILRRADVAGLPCYLETQTARNVPFYQKHGFAVVVETDAPGGGPHFWTMQRSPRTR
jgi:GNAT superfamily N-acetyltransferase